MVWAESALLVRDWQVQRAEDSGIHSSYFVDLSKRKVYQFCDKNARLKFKGSLEFKLDKIIYPDNSIKNFNHGCILIKCIIEPSGLTSNIQIIKGIDPECDSLVLQILSHFKTDKEWKPAKVDKVEVAQELIIPIDFLISGFSRYKNNYDNSWMIQQQMQQQMMRMQQPKIPTYRFK